MQCGTLPLDTSRTKLYETIDIHLKLISMPIISQFTQITLPSLDKHPTKPTLSVLTGWCPSHFVPCTLITMFVKRLLTKPLTNRLKCCVTRKRSTAPWQAAFCQRPSAGVLKECYGQLLAALWACDPSRYRDHVPKWKLRKCDWRVRNVVPWVSLDVWSVKINSWIISLEGCRFLNHSADPGLALTVFPAANILP